MFVLVNVKKKFLIVKATSHYQLLLHTSVVPLRNIAANVEKRRTGPIYNS